MPERLPITNLCFVKTIYLSAPIYGIFWTLLIMLPFIFLAFGLAYFTLPKKTVDSVLIRPYFSPAELVLYRIFPTKIAFIGLLSAAYCIPKIARKRFEDFSVRDHIPKWYKPILIVFFFLATIVSVGGVIMTVWYFLFEIPPLIDLPCQEILRQSPQK